MVSRSLLHPPFHEEGEGASQKRGEGLGFEKGLAAVQPITPRDDTPGGGEGEVIAMAVVNSLGGEPGCDKEDGDVNKDQFKV